MVIPDTYSPSFRTRDDLDSINGVLSKDFIDRDGRGFVYAAKGGGLQWQDGDDSALSDTFLAARNPEEIIFKAYDIARETVAVMDTGRKPRIIIDANGRMTRTGCTDGVRLYVSTRMFNDKGLSAARAADVFIGLTVHEGCHLKWTDFEQVGSLKGRLLRDIHNVIEDERIEHLLGGDRPALAGFLKATKYYFFGKMQEECLVAFLKDLAERYDALADGTDEERTAVIEEAFPRDGEEKSPLRIAAEKVMRLPRPVNDDDIIKVISAAADAEALVKAWMRSDTAWLLSSVFKMVRYPAALAPEDIDRWGDALMEVRDILLDWPKDTAEAVTTSERILEVILRYAPQEEKEDEDGEEGEEGEGGDRGDEEKESDDSTGDDNEEDEGEKKKGKGFRRARTGTPADGDGSGGLDAEDVEVIVGAILDAMEKIGARADGTNGENVADALKGDPFAQMKAEGICSRCEGGDATHRVVTITEPVTDSSERTYRESLARVSPYVGALRNALRRNAAAYSETLRGLRSGALDTGRLAEAYQGSPTVYSRKGMVRSDPMSVCVLVDESGSMGFMSGGTTRIDSARDAAVLIAEAAKGVQGLDLFVYGHSADNIERGTTELFVYRDHNVRTRFPMGNIRDRWNNADGYAIVECAKRVREQTRERCLMLVLSDGEPAALTYRSSSEGVEHTRKAVRQVTKEGFVPIHVWITDDHGKDVMFDNVVTFDGIKGLATDLAKLIKNAVVKGSSRKSV